MHQIFTQMYSTISIGPSHMDNATGFSQTPPLQVTFSYILLQNLFLLLPTHFSSLELSKLLKSKFIFSQETIMDCQIRTLTCYPLGHQHTLGSIILKHYMPINKPCSETLLTIHFPKAMQHPFVLKFHTHSLE